MIYYELDKEVRKELDEKGISFFIDDPDILKVVKELITQIRGGRDYCVCCRVQPLEFKEINGRRKVVICILCRKWKFVS